METVLDPNRYLPGKFRGETGEKCLTGQWICVKDGAGQNMTIPCASGQLTKEKKCVCVPERRPREDPTWKGPSQTVWYSRRRAKESKMLVRCHAYPGPSTDTSGCTSPWVQTLRRDKGHVYNLSWGQKFSHRYLLVWSDWRPTVLVV